MQKFRARVFKIDPNLHQMLLLRQAGWTYKSLAELFNCDFSTIYHHCQRFGVKPVTRVTVTPNIVAILTHREYVYVNPKSKNEEKWYVIDGEKINRGKSYQDYMNEYLRKK